MKKQKKDIFSTILLLAPFIFIMVIGWSLFGGNTSSQNTDDGLVSEDDYSLDYDDENDEDQNVSNNFDVDTIANVPPTGIKVKNILKRPHFTAKKNSTEMVDQIASVAKEYQAHLIKKNADKIIKKIRKQTPNFYKNNRTMELYMWYGYLLEYYYPEDDPRARLGMDVEQAIKYVYRRAEKESDISTQENLRQITKDLVAIDYD